MRNKIEFLLNKLKKIFKGYQVYLDYDGDYAIIKVDMYGAHYLSVDIFVQSIEDVTVNFCVFDFTDARLEEKAFKTVKAWCKKHRFKFEI